MGEYSCFLHPLQKGDSLGAACPVCKEKFGFPETSFPAQINSKPVQGNGRRGFYGVVFETTHPLRTGFKFAVKIIPQATYAASDRGGYGKSFEEEVTLHQELESTGLVPHLTDFGTDTLRFGSHDISCYWMEMEYVPGVTLAEKIQAAPEDPREIAQIAWDLLDFIHALEQRQRFHNDLHGDNIKIRTLNDYEARREAIDHRLRVVILDAGSAADHSKSGPERLGDVHWVARHIIELLNAFERTRDNIEPSTVRICAQLRRIAELCLAVDRARAPKPHDMKKTVYEAYRFGERPWRQPVQLGSISEHYNAQTLPSWFAPELLYDPQSRWARRLTGPGPMLLTGMRGCGKTILLRSLEWIARAHRGRSEAEKDVLIRVQADKFLGLFVSCAALLKSPRPKSLELPMHRLFLAFAREVVRNVQTCQLMNIGEIDYNALRPFGEMVARVVPWCQLPKDILDMVALERSLSIAVQEPPVSNGSRFGELSPRLVFDDLAITTRQLVDIWKNKKLLFLLDDVSPRYLPPDNVQELLSQLCLQSQDFGFKISTETQTLHLTTPGGEPARGGRDYEMFDLGSAVLARLGGKRGVDFIEGVLSKRTAITDAVSTRLPSMLLRRQDLIDIAKSIRDRPSNKTAVYWGIDALAGICVGDIGEVLQIYEEILDRARGETPSAETQHAAIIDFGERRLLSLAGQDEWLYSHAIAFAQASHEELRKSSGDRLRQYNEINVKIAPTVAAVLFPELIKLVDAGVFVFTGGTPRMKTRRSAPFLQFKLAYRKVLGLTNLIPLSMRDRFELSSSDRSTKPDKLAEWLKEPSGQKLQPAARAGVRGDGRKKTGPSSQTKTLPKPKQIISNAFQYHLKLSETTGVSHGRVSSEMQFSEDSRPSGLQPPLQPRVLYEVKTLSEREISKLETSFTDKHVIGAFGFETRSVGAWENLLRQGKPAAATMIQYPDIGLAAQIIAILNARSVYYKRTELPKDWELEDVRKIIESCGEYRVVVDTTSLTKPLIYTLVLEALRSKNEVWVLHTCASEYFPSDSDLEKVVSLFNAREYPPAFQLLNTIVAGEYGPYRFVGIGEQHRDPSQPSIMVTLLSLKYDRIVRLLAETPIEAIAAVCPIHTAGREIARSISNRFIAEYLVQRYGGKVYEIGSLDHEGCYRLLVDLHRKYALDSGYNFEIALTGSKLHVVGAAMLAATASPSGVYYSAPAKYDPEKFTKGTAETRIIHLKRVPNGTFHV